MVKVGGVHATKDCKERNVPRRAENKECSVTKPTRALEATGPIGMAPLPKTAITFSQPDKQLSELGYLTSVRIPKLWSASVE